MDENYVKSLQLWIDTMQVKNEQKLENIRNIDTQIELWSKERKLVKESFEHDEEWILRTKKELEKYISDNS